MFRWSQWHLVKFKPFIQRCFEILIHALPTSFSSSPGLKFLFLVLNDLFFCWLNVPNVPGSTSEHRGHKYELRDVFGQPVRHLLPSLAGFFTIYSISNRGVSLDAPITVHTVRHMWGEWAWQCTWICRDSQTVNQGLPPIIVTVVLELTAWNVFCRSPFCVWD